MKNKILFLLLILCPLIDAHETDSPEAKQNQTVTICKYAGAATGTLIGGVAGYILKKKITLEVRKGYPTFKTYEKQTWLEKEKEWWRESKILLPWWVELFCELGIPMAGYTAGEKLGTKIGLWLTKQ